MLTEFCSQMSRRFPQDSNFHELKFHLEFKLELRAQNCDQHSYICDLTLLIDDKKSMSTGSLKFATRFLLDRHIKRASSNLKGKRAIPVDERHNLFEYTVGVLKQTHNSSIVNWMAMFDYSKGHSLN